MRWQEVAAFQEQVLISVPLQEGGRGSELFTAQCYRLWVNSFTSDRQRARTECVTDEDTVKRYYAKFEEKFFQTCEKELAKINTFYSEKLAEAQRRFATLQNELQSSLDAQRESSAPDLRRRHKTVFHLSHEERVKSRNIKDLQLAFSEFYLSLILLQNYQNLNFTGFRKILKKHDKILETPAARTGEWPTWRWPRSTPARRSPSSSPRPRPW
ncbi:hypothetical protein ANANG_G00078820 [Anguilla anguilla]|uniref:SPX domain-containing protein n=1 Tax=Anguilla anguilla TaxID=7936 RepID=A0A9D3MLH9_ANGAN|nr:hypothetical protein ANANG_G00078820 [Anguilla anguilla]